jgi:N-acetylated-alpha-linked acidic dipeptidase
MVLLYLVLVILITLVSSQTPEESIILNSPNTDSLATHLRSLANKTHLAGSKGDLDTAIYVYNLFKEYGLQNVRFDNYTNLLQEPLKRELMLTDPIEDRYNATLYEYEPNINNQTDMTDLFPTWLGYTGNGTVEGPLVYVNYGRIEDFEALVKKKISFNGTICLIRYGKNMRGTKILTAEKYGCIGAVLYSDPIDDGFFVGEPYGDGPWRSKSSVQRGSIMDIGACAGNPSPDRIKNECNSTHQLIPSIPALPISYQDAEPFLYSLRRSNTPVDYTWQGGLSFHYHHGPGNTTVKMTVESKLENKPSWNIIGEIPADPNSEEKDKIVGFGNHRDAWTYGALDPNSGTTVMLEVIRVLNILQKEPYNWKPERTIQFYSWDSEEWGLIGSTSFAERNADYLIENMLVYINIDTAISNPNPSLRVDSSGGFIDTIRSDAIIGKIIDPNTNLPFKSVWDQQVGTLGSGSDYAAFIHHLGIPSYNSVFQYMGFPTGVYHSRYDDISVLEKFVDPGYKYHRVQTQIYGLLVYHFSSDLIFPLTYDGYYERLVEYSNTLQSILISQNINMDLTDLNDAIDNFGHAASSVSAEIKSAVLYPDILELNYRLSFTERQFIIPEGLPQRHWFKHVLQAPGLGKGYGSVIFPGIDDAIQSGNMQQAEEQLKIISEKILAASNFLRGSEKTHPLSENTIVVASVVGALVGIFLFIVVGYFRWAKKSSKDEEAIGLMKKEVAT